MDCPASPPAVIIHAIRPRNVICPPGCPRPRYRKGRIPAEAPARRTLPARRVTTPTPRSRPRPPAARRPRPARGPRPAIPPLPSSPPSHPGHGRADRCANAPRLRRRHAVRAGERRCPPSQSPTPSGAAGAALPRAGRPPPGTRARVRRRAACAAARAPRSPRTDRRSSTPSRRAGLGCPGV